MSLDYVEARVASQRRVRRRRPWLEEAQIPFRDDAPMVGPPGTTAADFEMPRLRRCPFHLDSMVLEARLDGGMDGYVWEVRFGARKPFVLKVFWDAEPVDFPTYYAPQRECQNAALLQMMQSAVEQAAKASHPILLNAKPTTWRDAVTNLMAFSDEARLEQPSPADYGSAPPPGLRQILTVPRMKRCYGWMTIPGKLLGNPPQVQVGRIKRSLSRDQEYIAIVYEYVEEGDNDPDAMQKAMDFFWLAGFSRTHSPLLANWKSGVLVDLSDIVPPCGYGWQAGLYGEGPGCADILLKQHGGPLQEEHVHAGRRGAQAVHPLRPRHFPDRAAMQSVKRGALVDAQERNMLTPLHLAAQNGHSEATNALIAAHASVDAAGEDQWTPLHHAALNSHTEAINALIAAHASVDGRPHSVPRQL